MPEESKTLLPGQSVATDGKYLKSDGDKASWQDSDAGAMVSAHNTSETAHDDIRQAIPAAVSAHDGSETAHTDIRGQLSAIDAQLAEKVQNFKIKNEVVNGDFLSGLTGWLVGGISQSISDDIITITTTVGAGYIRQTSASIAGKIVYGFAKAKTINSGWRFRFFDVEHVKVPSDQFDFLSARGVASATDRRINITNTSVGMTVEVDCVGVVILTDIFGAGNEPTKLEMDELVKVIPNGWWDGELTLNQKQFITWQLNIIRKNTNAIIALGGTII